MGNISKRRMSDSDPDPINPSYFILPHPANTAWILFCLFYLMPSAIFLPDLLPDVTPFSQYSSFVTSYSTPWLVVYVAAMLVHLAETVVAVWFTVKYGLNIATKLKWIASTFIHGGFSLWYLIKWRKYKEEKTWSCRRFP